VSLIQLLFCISTIRLEGHGGCDYEWPCVTDVEKVSCLSCSSLYFCTGERCFHEAARFAVHDNFSVA
jgi:hypothetical protein